MKNLIMFLILFSLGINVKAQSENQIINTSLLSYLNDLENLTENLEKLNTSSVSPKKYFDELYILTDNYSRNFNFSEKIKQKQKKYISIINDSKQKKIKKGANIVFFDGIRLNNNRLIVLFSERAVKRESRNHLNIALIAGTHYTYEYMCDKQEWVLVEVKHV